LQIQKAYIPKHSVSSFIETQPLLTKLHDFELLHNLVQHLNAL